ncbi:DUF1826 domain-containing protein [Pseudomonas tohonis]|uniref:DUF1826 domain-containing protein n=1 Tax=Pseudomonas tohonis TaxID=2725477 RepID=UPI0021D8DB19|nr:DUF1826 domain-containing protein [Pseudomonas tohonis]UXY52966.1 DUF1826 domain-containing protein [Pseudomonas tohonis]
MQALALRLPPRAAIGDTPAVLGEALREEVNLAVWERPLPPRIADYARRLLQLGEPLSESLALELADPEAPPDLGDLARRFHDIEGRADFIADVAWLVRAFACLLDARRVGLRLRRLDRAMCPRYHVDHVPLRLITTYAGAGSQWLREGQMPRSRLGDAAAEPKAAPAGQAMGAGHVALFKGEKWIGNEGRGVIHRSPDVMPGDARLLLTLDWLA